MMERPEDESKAPAAPTVSPGLVNYLKSIFPNELPRSLPLFTERDVAYSMGEQHVVSHLAHLLEQQQERATSGASTEIGISLQ